MEEFEKGLEEGTQRKDMQMEQVQAAAGLMVTHTKTLDEGSRKQEKRKDQDAR